MRSVFVGQPDWDAHAESAIYLDELDRQCRLANLAFGSALKSAMLGNASTEPDEPWASLQGGLFASILVYRLLLPGPVRHPFQDMTRAQSQAFSNARGQRLRALLDIDSDEPLLRDLLGTRNALEHFDERLDAVMALRPTSVVDFYVSDGTALMTSDSPGPDGVAGYSFRTLFPEGGLLYFGRDSLDLFALDAGLFVLRDRIRAARQPPPTGIRATFGGVQLVQILDPVTAERRCRDWIAMREAQGMPVGLTVAEEAARSVEGATGND